MGFFDRFRKPTRTCHDEAFGALTYKHTSWTGHVAFPPTKNDVMILIETDGTEPLEQHRVLFSELLDRYASLRPAIAAALFGLWEPHLEEWGGEVPPIVTSEDTMLRYTTLDYIELGLPSRIVLGYGFTEEVGWDDAMFSVIVNDWQVSAGSLDD